MKQKAVVLLSGGQDSTTCLYWAKQRFEEVVAIGFDYGQKHRQELEQAKKIAELAGVPYKVFNLAGVFGGSALVDMSIDVNAPHSIDEGLPATFTAGRNATFLSIAAGYAFNNGARYIVTGVCQTDYSGYPDCRQVFINAMEVAVSKALDDEFVIHTPLMFLTKAETWKMAKDLGILDVIINDTLTDYNGSMVRNEWGYGENNNPATALRVKGFYEAKEKGWI